MAAITLAELTTATLTGNGVFDTLMRANKAHLESEFDKGRIKGPEYATVYLGSLQSIMSTALAFMTQRQKIDLEAQLLAQQILLAQAEVTKANASVLLVQAEVAKANAAVLLTQAQTAQAQAELALIQANAGKIAAEVGLITQQTAKLALEVEKIPLEKLQITAQTAMITQQKLNAIDDLLTAAAQRDKLEAELENIPKQGVILDKQAIYLIEQAREVNTNIDTSLFTRDNLGKQGLILDIQAINLTAEGLNIPKQGEVLFAQKCKLEAEFDLTASNTLKSASEIELLNQKTATEKAQVTAFGVDPVSITGRQMDLYKAQADGFQRDAEQKAAKLLVDTWNVRRTTDEGTTANTINQLDDSSVGRAVGKVLVGVGA